ncbi:MAG: metallophosphoesterase [Planctomycetaceae bacterium]|nr:metallophosphoesterase [Planctomycetaceae bacterium]
MPVHQLPLSRREFLSRSAAVLASLSIAGRSWGAQSVESSTFALLSDTHIAANPETIARETNMTANLRQVVGEVCALEQKPAGVIVSGDCAYLKGLPDDYANFASIVKPLGERGLPLHLLTGNHDDRGPMAEALAVQRPEDPQVQSRFVSVIESPHANLFLLDSLFEVDVVTGELGEAQRMWLTRELDARKDKPAVIIGHHNLQFTAPPEGKRFTGLADTTEFVELLEARPHVKAYIFGHTHSWSATRHGNLHLINLPPVAYVFGKDRPNGWTQATFTPTGVTLELNTINSAHPLSGEKKELTWA